MDCIVRFVESLENPDVIWNGHMSVTSSAPPLQRYVIGGEGWGKFPINNQST